MSQILFLDRDGVILDVPEGVYVDSPDDVKLYDFSVDALLKYQDRVPFGNIVIVSNQAAIGLGMLRPIDAVRIDKSMRRTLEKGGVDVRYPKFISLICPHTEHDFCGCRKPMPGLLYAGAGHHCEMPWGSFMVGDFYTDMMAGDYARCRNILVCTGRGQSENNKKGIYEQRPKIEYTAENLWDAISYICDEDRRRREYAHYKDSAEVQLDRRG